MPIANSEFLVNVVPGAGRQPPRGAEDRRRLPRRGGVRRRRRRGAGARLRPAVAVTRPAARSSRPSASSSTAGTGWAPRTSRRARASARAQHVVAADAAPPVDPPAEERAVEPQPPEVERRAAEDLARDAVRVRRRRRATARARRGAGGPRRRRSSTRAGPRRAAARLVEQRRADGLVGMASCRVGRTLASASPRPASGHAASVRASSIRLPVGLAPAVPALAEAADLALARRRAHRAGHAAQLLVAGHPARPRHGLVAVDLGRGRRAPRSAGRSRGARRRSPRATRAAARRRSSAGRRARSRPSPRPRRARPAARDRGHRLATREQQRERAAERAPLLAGESPIRASP